MQKNKIYNKNYLKELFYQEINQLDLNLKEYGDLEFYITNLEIIIQELEKGDYSALKSNWIYLDTFLPMFYNISGLDSKYKKISEKIYDAIGMCEAYEGNPERYDRKQYNSAKSYITHVKAYLESLLVSKTIEINNINKEKTKDNLINYKRILTNLKYGKPIDKNQYVIINNLLEEKGYATDSIIILLEEVRKHNTTINLKKKNRKINYDKLNEITGMFNLGFEYFEIPYLGKNTAALDEYIKTIKTLLNTNHDTAFDILPIYEGDLKFTSNYAKQEYSYIFNSILMYLQNNILDTIELMNDINNYTDKEMRNYILSDYKKLLFLYITIRKIYFENLDKYNEDLNLKTENEDVINLSYAATSNNNISYIESDLKDIPKDRYKDLMNLLIRFKKGLLAPSELKYLNEAFPGMGELRDDQLRILFKRDDDNNFVIIGAFIKKEDNDRRNYVKFYNRGMKIRLNKDVAEETLFEKIASSKHSGGRKNA